VTALAGLWRFGGGADGAGCARMLAAQALYGPHGSAQGELGEAALGRALFRTLPEDRFDRQPLAGGEGRFLLVADARLDNRDELAEALRVPPERAKIMADADFLLAAWERWQDSLFAHLLGDYAFALWDAQERRLSLARDPFGARPLHYHCGTGFAAFASMPKGLHALAEVPSGPDEERVAELLALIPEDGPSSYFRGIHRVEPGQLIVLTKEGPTARSHWQPRREPLHLPRAEDYAEALREQFDRAVGARLRGANGSVAAHLSGGRDSGAVAATAARLLGPTGGRVTGFTAVPRSGYDGTDPEGRFGDEGPVAARTAALHSNLDQVLVPTPDRNLLHGLDRAFFLYDRPLLNPCNQRWFDAISDAARERRHTILLTGQMGNMTISYSGMEWLSHLAASGCWLRLLRECRALVRAGRMSWKGALVQALGPWLPAPVWRALSRLAGRAVTRPESYSALAAARRGALDLEARVRAQGLDLPDRPARDGWQTRLRVLRQTDPGNHHKGVLGGWGIDLRDPTCDRRLVEFCLSVPPEHYLAHGQPAALFARAFADRLPADILEGRRRGLQAVDWHEGLTAAREELRVEIARLSEVPCAAQALDLARMAKLVEDWPQGGGWQDRETVLDYRLALLRGTASGHFLRKALGSNA
jgi:asparagine synthase (glutamine-hydrolysing)